MNKDELVTHLVGEHGFSRAVYADRVRSESELVELHAKVHVVPENKSLSMDPEGVTRGEIHPSVCTTRHPDFEDHVRSGDLDDLLSLACPYCGCLTVDHSWSASDSKCLKCDCKGWAMVDPGESMLMLSTGEAYHGRGPDGDLLDEEIRRIKHNQETELLEIEEPEVPSGGPDD
jgi:hypothetical protein